MAPNTSPASTTRDRELHLTRVFDAPRRLVYKAWTEPEHLALWWGPRGFTLPGCRVDFRPGGSYRFVMRSPEGKEHRLEGTYREVVENERLVFTYAWVDEAGQLGHETIVVVTFADEGGRTRLTLHQAVFESTTARDLHDEGWSGALARLTESLAVDSSVSRSTER